MRYRIQIRNVMRRGLAVEKRCASEKAFKREADLNNLTLLGICYPMWAVNNLTIRAPLMPIARAKAILTMRSICKHSRNLAGTLRLLPLFLSLLSLIAPTVGAYASSTADRGTRGTQGLRAPINGILVQQTGTASGASDQEQAVAWSQASLTEGIKMPGLWSLPILGPLKRVNSVIRATHRLISKPQQAKELKGGICLADDQNKLGQRVDELLETALDRNTKTRVLDQAVAHYRTATQKVIAETKDASDYLIPWRGFGPSSEAGDIILDEKVKLKSRASAEYARQKHIDETHLKVVSSVMQLAMGLGMSDLERGQHIVASGLASLKELVGEEEAVKTMQMLSSWTQSLHIPESVYAQGAWDVAQRQDKMKTVMESSLDSDPVVHQIKKRLHKFNHRSTFARASAHVVQTTLGAASLTPSFIGPAAKLALLSFVMATGGPEQCKLLKELYLDKRFESRWKVLNEEAHLALDNYQVAVLTRNPVLLACSESVVEQMAGAQVVSSALGASVLASAAGPATTPDSVNDGETRSATPEQEALDGESDAPAAGALAQSSHVVSQ